MPAFRFGGVRKIRCAPNPTFAPKPFRNPLKLLTSAASVGRANYFKYLADGIGVQCPGKPKIAISNMSKKPSKTKLEIAAAMVEPIDVWWPKYMARVNESVIAAEQYLEVPTGTISSIPNDPDFVATVKAYA